MYRQCLENRFAEKDSRGAWKALETMTNYKPKKKMIQTDNAHLFVNEMKLIPSTFSLTVMIFLFSKPKRRR